MVGGSQAAVSDRTLGQIAWEAAKEWHGHPRQWQDASLSEQSSWEHVAQAVAQAVAPLPETES